MFRSPREQRIQVGAKAVKVNEHDRSCSGGSSTLERLKSRVPVVLVTVDRHWGGSRFDDRPRARKDRERRNQNFVRRSKSKRSHRHIKGGSAAAYGDSV